MTGFTLLEDSSTFSAGGPVTVVATLDPLVCSNGRLTLVNQLLGRPTYPTQGLALKGASSAQGFSGLTLSTGGAVDTVKVVPAAPGVEAVTAGNPNKPATNMLMCPLNHVITGVFGQATAALPGRPASHIVTVGLRCRKITSR